MNSLNILFSYNYISSLVVMTWFDILFGINEGFLNSEAAFEHAYNIIEKEENPSQKTLDLAFLSQNESIYPLIEKLVNDENYQDKQLTREKYLFAVLNWVYENQNLFVEPLSAVECIYADFDYPENISEFIRYASNSEADLGSLELNLKRIHDKWENYLEKEKEKWKYSSQVELRG